MIEVYARMRIRSIGVAAIDSWLGAFVSNTGLTEFKSWNAQCAERAIVGHSLELALTSSNTKLKLFRAWRRKAMPRPFGTRRRNALILIATVSAFLAGPAVAEIVKCVAKDGSPLYQNFPCHIDSLGSMPSTPIAAKPVQSARGESAKAPANSVKANDSLIGMTADEVVKLLGEPEERTEDEPPSGRISIWRYADGRLVRFNNRHRVLGVQK